MTKLLYIGSGVDFEPLGHFRDVKEFVFIDTLPRSRHDGLKYKNSLFYEGFYSPNFIFQLIKQINKFDYELVKKISLEPEYYNKYLTQEQKKFWGNNFLEKFPDINPQLLIFVNNKSQQILRYYISTNILTNMYDILKTDISESDCMLISGFHPDKIILEYITRPIKLYCDTKTCYFLHDDEVDNYNNIIYWLFNNLDKISSYFNKIYAYEKINGNITLCDNLIHMNQFVENIKNNN